MKINQLLQHLIVILFLQFSCIGDIPKNQAHRIAESCLVNLVGCLPSSGFYMVAGNIAYEGSPYIFSQNALITPITPTVTGVISSCSVLPALPTGLSISSTTCEITGTPLVGNLATSYMITATINLVSISATFILKIQGTTALKVYGQSGSFTSNTLNNGGITANSLYYPWGISVDAIGNLYVGDYANNRVLYFLSGTTTAVQVYGQAGSFTTQTANKGGLSANSLYGPVAGKKDASGNLYVTDYYNHRVLFFPTGSTTATRVYGQGGDFSTNTVNNGGISANSLNILSGLNIDTNDNLYVADSHNHRVLFFPSGSTTATRVYGQGGNFTTNIANNGGISASSLNNPVGIAIDSGGNLYVSEYLGNRILYFPSGSTTATRVYGQGGDFSTNTANNGGVSANSLNIPYGMVLDTNDNLYVADYDNHRVLFFPNGSTTATRVYGQGGNFTTNTINKGGLSANSLYSPGGVALDAYGNLYVTDVYNHRVLVF